MIFTFLFQVNLTFDL